MPISDFRAGRFLCAVRGSRREAWLRSKFESCRLGAAGYRGIGRPQDRHPRVAVVRVLHCGMRGLCVRTSSLQRWLGHRRPRARRATIPVSPGTIGCATCQSGWASRKRSGRGEGRCKFCPAHLYCRKMLPRLPAPQDRPARFRDRPGWCVPSQRPANSSQATCW